jgi:hypothetical protein
VCIIAGDCAATEEGSAVVGGCIVVAGCIVVEGCMVVDGCEIVGGCIIAAGCSLFAVCAVVKGPSCVEAASGIEGLVGGIRMWLDAITLNGILGTRESLIKDIYISVAGISLQMSLASPCRSVELVQSPSTGDFHRSESNTLWCNFAALNISIICAYRRSSPAKARVNPQWGHMGAYDSNPHAAMISVLLPWAISRAPSELEVAEEKQVSSRIRASAAVSRPI